MKLTVFVKFLALATVVSLGYIQIQMEIIDLAYQGKAKEKEIRRLIEENGGITYSILAMKSASHLGGTVLTEDSELEFADPDNIVQVISTDGLIEEEVSVEEEKENPLLSLLSFGDQAEAKVSDK